MEGLEIDLEREYPPGRTELPLSEPESRLGIILYEARPHCGFVMGFAGVGVRFGKGDKTQW